MTPVLRLEGVTKTYHRGDEQVQVLVDFDFALDAGEFVVVTVTLRTATPRLPRRTWRSELSRPRCGSACCADSPHSLRWIAASSPRGECRTA